MNQPKVSIVSVSYNQENYIRQTLDSFLEQQADFNFEIIIADDCSTDNTPKIIREYAKAHPKLFKPILREKNVGVAENFYGALRAASGKYIALCEGDDYWTDPAKLQRQVEFLDMHLDYALCFHPVKVFFETGESKDHVYPEERRAEEFTLEKLLQGNFIQTNSVMYRKQSYENMPPDILPVDWYLHLYHAQFGKIGFIDKVMSAYRRHEGGVWWGAYANREKLWERQGLKQLNLYNEILKLYGDNENHKQLIYGSIVSGFQAIIGLAAQGNTALLAKALAKFPEMGQGFILTQYFWTTEEKKQLFLKEKEMNEQLQQLQSENQKLAVEGEQLIAQCHVLETELAAIINSKKYRTVSKLADIKQKAKRVGSKKRRAA